MIPEDALSTLGCEQIRDEVNDCQTVRTSISEATDEDQPV